MWLLLPVLSGMADVVEFDVVGIDDDPVVLVDAAVVVVGCRAVSTHVRIALAGGIAV